MTSKAATKLAAASERTVTLAKPKRTPSDYEESREVQSIPTTAARNTRASERIEALAEAKKQPSGPFREPDWPVSKKAMKAQPSERIRELSRSKGLVEGFQVRNLGCSFIKTFANTKLSHRATEMSSGQ